MFKIAFMNWIVLWLTFWAHAFVLDRMKLVVILIAVLLIMEVQISQAARHGYADPAALDVIEQGHREEECTKTKIGYGCKVRTIPQFWSGNALYTYKGYLIEMLLFAWKKTTPWHDSPDISVASPSFKNLYDTFFLTTLSKKVSYRFLKDGLMIEILGKCAPGGGGRGGLYCHVRSSIPMK